MRPYVAQDKSSATSRNAEWQVLNGLELFRIGA